MKATTVFAVMTARIEIPVRSSSVKETFEQTQSATSETNDMQTDQDAFEVWASEHPFDLQHPKRVWSAALAWLRSQGEPVAWMNAKKEMTYFGHYNPDDVPLFLTPQPAIPDGWQSAAALLLAEIERLDRTPTAAPKPNK